MFANKDVEIKESRTETLHRNEKHLLGAIIRFQKSLLSFPFLPSKQESRLASVQESQADKQGKATLKVFIGLNCNTINCTKGLDFKLVADFLSTGTADY